MYGAVAEIGAFRLTSASLKNSGVPKLFKNEYGWQQRASVVVFDFPPPVGYSTCSPCPLWNDTSTGKETFDALQVFFFILSFALFFLVTRVYAGLPQEA